MPCPIGVPGGAFMSATTTKVGTPLGEFPYASTAFASRTRRHSSAEGDMVRGCEGAMIMIFLPAKSKV